jgi:two-component sensor histidine kinase/ligand-binding sensor protein/DNA-binding response OmpR family regulator
MNTPGQKTILLVEDEIIIAAAEKMQLEEAGYRVVLAHTGEQAIESVRNKDAIIDIILMDINLGNGIDGTEAAQEILKTREIPLLFLSSHTEKEIVEKTEAITNYGYVVKNSSITVLDASIKMAFKLFDAYMNIRFQRSDLESANDEMRIINENLIRSETELIKSESEVRNKLKTILEPDGDISTLRLADIIDYQSIQSLMEDFFKLTGILGAILDIKGNILVATGWQDICTKFHRCNPETAQHCRESDIELTNGVPEGTYKLYRCKNNMWDMVTPLVIDNCHIGNIFIGQFMFEDEKADLEVFREQAREYGFDENEYLDALSRVPRFSREKVNTGMAFYSKVAKMISSLSYSSIKLSRTIAQQKKAEDEVRRLLVEKELILKEVHHRVKNNMGIINSLLLIQSRNQDNTVVKNILYDAASRVESMKILYDKLYQSEGYQRISLKEYISQLVREIVDIFPKQFNIDVDMRIEDTLLDAKTVSIMGIIVNEMIINSLKYAFEDRGVGKITVESRIESGRVHFSYEDDGVGIPDQVTFENSTGFGMQLINMLVRQMNGTIQLDRVSGKKFVLEFDS